MNIRESYPVAYPPSSNMQVDTQIEDSLNTVSPKGKRKMKKRFSEVRKLPVVDEDYKSVYDTLTKQRKMPTVRKAVNVAGGAAVAGAVTASAYAAKKLVKGAKAIGRGIKHQMKNEEVEGVDEGTFASTKGWNAKTSVIDPDKRETERKITSAQVETEKARRAKKLAQMTANMKGAALKKESSTNVANAANARLRKGQYQENSNENEGTSIEETSDAAVHHARADAYGKKFWAKVEKTRGDKMINKLRNTSKAQSNYDKAKGSVKLHAGDQLATEQTADDAADEVAGNKNYMRLKQQRAMFKAKKAKELEKNKPAPLKTSTASVKTEEVKPSPLSQDVAQKARKQKDRIAKLQANLSSMRSRGMRMGPMVQNTQNQLAKARSRGG